MKSLGTIVTAGLVAVTGSFHAAEETLTFRLVTRALVNNAHTNPAIEGLEISSNQAVGVAVFEDGRLAYKEYVAIGLDGPTPAPTQGYSSYVFENGDSIQLAFASGEGDGVFVYTVLSGTGAYEGATGTGQITNVSTEWDDANLFDGSITVTTP